jgi:hypothetical protein
MLLDNNNVPSYDQQNRIETKERSRCDNTHSAFAKERKPPIGNTILSQEWNNTTDGPCQCGAFDDHSAGTYSASS